MFPGRGQLRMNGQIFRGARRQCPAWALALAIVLTLPISVSAQTGGIRFEQGTHAFRYVLSNFGLKPLKDESELDENSILIVFGETQIVDMIPGGLNKFL